MADNMQTHDMSIHVQKTSTHSDMHEFESAITVYRAHFKKKATAKLHVVMLETDMVTGVVTQIYNEMLVHPIKEKIVINKPVHMVKKASMPPPPEQLGTTSMTYNWDSFGTSITATGNALGNTVVNV